MTPTTLLLATFLLVLSISTSFVFRSNSIVSRNKFSAVNKDLFSDDLFEDESESTEKSPKKSAPDTPTPSRKYLDQDWKLNENESKANKIVSVSLKDQFAKSKLTPDQKIPIFALMYKFRKEYYDFGAESVLADHKGHCAKFSRVAYTQPLKIAKARGVVTIFMGENEKDKDSTRAEVMSFLEEDPLIEKDTVETWDVIDLSENGSSAELLESVGATK